MIGRRCTHGNVFSRPVLIGRGLDRTLSITFVLAMEFSGFARELTFEPGDHGGGDTPVPIPNTAVKPTRADGTWEETPWESRSPPDFS